jgi:hypothetical protein
MLDTPAFDPDEPGDRRHRSIDGVPLSKLRTLEAMRKYIEELAP